jgi:hypothetical protein
LLIDSLLYLLNICLTLAVESEALFMLWSLGIVCYPFFGPF